MVFKKALPPVLFVALFLAGAARVATQAPAAEWWAHVAFLADDRMKGRETGSPEHREAAEYIAHHFKEAGLQPGGTDGYFQSVPFRSRSIVESRSSLALVRGGEAVPVVLGDEATFSMRIEPAPHVEAPIVFAGYGLQVPEAKHDDLAGPRPQRQSGPAVDWRPLVHSGTAACALPEHPVVVSEEGGRRRRDFHPKPQGAGHSLG
jgi:hypothetical protein